MSFVKFLWSIVKCLFNLFLFFFLLLLLLLLLLSPKVFFPSNFNEGLEYNKEFFFLKDKVCLKLNIDFVIEEFLDKLLPRVFDFNNISLSLSGSSK